MTKKTKTVRIIVFEFTEDEYKNLGRIVEEGHCRQALSVVQDMVGNDYPKDK